MKKEKWAGYCRLSDPKKHKKEDLDVQEKENQAWGNQEGYTIIPYLEPGVSGKDTDHRPVYQQMMADLEGGVVVGVLARESARLWRNLTEELADRKQISSKWKRHIVTRDGVYDTRKGKFTPERELFANMQAAVNEWYRTQVGPKVKAKAKYKAQKGERPGGRIPFGYKRPAQGVLAIHDEEGKVVMLIFDWFLAKENLHSVVMKLNAAGYRTRQGDHWNKWSVKSILDNRVYVGDLLYDGEVTPNVFPPIVSRKTLEAAQQLRKQITKAYPTRSLRSPYLLSGLVYCHCGSRMQGHKNNKWTYYRCYDGQHKGKTACPTQTWIRTDKLEDLIVESLFDLRLDPKELRRRLIQTNQDCRRDLPGLRKKIAVLEGQLTKWMGSTDRIKAAYAQGDYDLPEMRQELTKAKEKIEQIETDLAQVYTERDTTEAGTTNVGFAVECLEHAFDEYQAQRTFPERQVLIRQLIDRVVVQDQRSGDFTVRHLDKLYTGQAGDQPFTVRPDRRRRKGIVSPKILAALSERSGSLLHP